MRLRRGSRGRTISLVPLVDVLLILLVFFMVTSRYERLGAVPIMTAAQTAGPAAEAGETVLLRLDAEGRVRAAGTRDALDAAELAAFLGGRQGARVRVLASPEARAQGLVTLAEAAAHAGVRDLRLIRVVEGP